MSGPVVRNGRVWHCDGTEAWPDDPDCTCTLDEARVEDGYLHVTFTPARDCPVHQVLA